MCFSGCEDWTLQLVNETLVVWPVPLVGPFLCSLLGLCCLLMAPRVDGGLGFGVSGLRQLVNVGEARS